MLYYSWKCVEGILVPLVASFGLLGHCLRKVKRRCRRGPPEPSPFKRTLNETTLDDSRDSVSDFEKGDLIIVLDLDQTLVHAQQAIDDADASFVVVSGDSSSLKVFKRPYLDKFLAEVSKHGEVHVYTASTRQYADQVLDQIDPRGYVTGRYYREHCVVGKDGQLTKSMDVITKNLQKLVVIDDSEQVYQRYRENTIHVEPWTGGLRKDIWLKECLKILNQLRYSNPKDVRKVLP